MYVVAGVTGHTGAATADALLKQGAKVRVVVREASKGEAWARRGAEVAVADLADPAAFSRALQGAKGVYVLSPPNMAAAGTAGQFLADRLAFGQQLVAGLRAAKVPAVVALSSVGAQHPAGTGPIVSTHRFEQLLTGVAPSVTLVRAAYFLDNWAGMVPLARKEGVLPHYGDTSYRFHQVGTGDIGAAAAAALLHPADGLRVIELAGKEDWSADDVAAALGTLLGRAVKAVGAPVESARAGLAAAGLPPGMADLYAEMYQGMGRGLMAFERPAQLTRGTSSLADALAPFTK
jgi:uncharacterized protein YbjT (DUF2867 family)